MTTRRQERRGQDWIGPELDVAAHTVCRVLRRHGVPYLRECDPLTGEVISPTRKAPPLRWVHPTPGREVRRARHPSDRASNDSTTTSPTAPQHTTIRSLRTMARARQHGTPATAHSQAAPRPADCHQRGGRIQLETPERRVRLIAESFLVIMPPMPRRPNRFLHTTASSPPTRHIVRYVVHVPPARP